MNQTCIEKGNKISTDKFGSMRNIDIGSFTFYNLRSISTRKITKSFSKELFFRRPKKFLLSTELCHRYPMSTAQFWNTSRGEWFYKYLDLLLDREFHCRFKSPCSPRYARVSKNTLCIPQYIYLVVYYTSCNCTNDKWSISFSYLKGIRIAEFGYSNSALLLPMIRIIKGFLHTREEPVFIRLVSKSKTKIETLRILTKRLLLVRSLSWSVDLRTIRSYTQSTPMASIS